MASLKYLKSRRKWWVRWRATNRKTHLVWSGSRCFAEKSQAIRFFAEVEDQEKAYRSGQLAAAESILEAKQEFLVDCRKHTTRTQGHYRMVLDRFVAGLPPDVRRLVQIEPFHLKEYLYRLRDLSNSNRTLNAHLTAIKSFCRHYSRRHRCSNPASEVPMFTEDPPQVRFLTPKEFETIIKVANDMQRARLLFLAHTGLRASEFASLAPDSVNHALTSITITGKGRRKRTIPLNQTARKALQQLKPATANALNTMCRRLAHKVKIPLFGPHALRHWFATQLLLKGVPIIKVSLLLGHRSVRTTQKCYSHILSADLADVTFVLD